MTRERDPHGSAAVPEESGTVADIGAISATESAFDRLARGEPPAPGDDPALRLLAGLARDVRSVPPPPAWRTGADVPEESPARPGRAVRVGRRAALTGVGTVAVSVLCAVGVAAATGVDPIAAVTHGRMHLAPPAVTAPPTTGKPRPAEPDERAKPHDPPSVHAGGTTGPANPHRHPPGKAKGWTRGNGNGNGQGAGPGADHGKHKGQAKGNDKPGNATPDAAAPGARTNADTRTTSARNPSRTGQTAPRPSAKPKSNPAADPRRTPHDHARPQRPGHQNGPGQGRHHGNDQRK